ncbi:hypothetical protein Taro_031094 [Colocasia esculenta]|uniref:Uncharacterized protein n=1 Tax=Colocasia esculenta TaxID=4460 RepID=A0A843VHZ9_COLES|nr:hypothetical protein [Colocasia esculenta]
MRLLPLGWLRSRKNRTHSLHLLKQKATHTWSRCPKSNGQRVTFREPKGNNFIVDFYLSDQIVV